MRRLFLIAIFLYVVSGLTSCELPGNDVATQEEVALASARLQAFLREYDERLLAIDPNLATLNGSREGYDKLSPMDEARQQEKQGLLIAWMERMSREVDTNQLDPWSAMHYFLFKAYADQQEQDYRWRNVGFPRDPADLPGLDVLLSTAHPLQTPADAEAFVKRLEALPGLLKQWQVRLEAAEHDSLLPVRSVLADVRRKAVQSAGLVTADSHLVADPGNAWILRINSFTETHPELGNTGANLRRRAWEAYSYESMPEYNHLLQWFYKTEAKADTVRVVRSMPSGSQWYNYLLSRYAGVPTTADDAYTLGLHRVDELENELRKLITAEKFPGSVPKFIDSLRVSQELYLFNAGPAGKVEFVQRVSRMHDSLSSGLKKFTDLMPSYPVTFSATEVPAKEGEAALQWMPKSGEAPGRLTLNLGCRDQLESWRWPAQLVQQGVPGRLLPEAYHAAIRDSFMIFRRLTDAPWYFEGWALYSVSLPWETGLYKDSTYARSMLLNELIHAVTLVVDAGMHSNQWTLPQAELYIKEKTPLSEGQRKMLIRGVLENPGASVASVAGCERIRKWRAAAEQSSMKNFSAPAFHYLLLRKGPLPVPVMEREIRLWLAPSTPEEPES